MSIKQEQLKLIVNEIIKSELQKGMFPSSQTVLWEISKYLQEHDLNEPSNALRIARTNNPINPDDYNASVQEIYNDLCILYRNLIKFQNEAMSGFDQFEIEKRKYEYQIDNLEKQLTEIITGNIGDAFRKSTFDIFTDMEHVDFDNTNANVDIYNKETTIAKTNGQSIKMPAPSGTKVSFSVPSSQIVSTSTATGDVNNVLNDMENLVWQQEVNTETQEEIIGTLTIEFPSVVQINQIDVSLHSIKTSMLMVQTSLDGQTWSLLPRYKIPVEILDRTSLTFPMTNVKKLRILISKDEADKLIVTKDKTTYVYLFGIKSISFFMASYRDKSTLQSKVFDMDGTDVFTIDKVSLVTETDAPNGTLINYYIALDSATPQWVPISDVNDPHPRFSKTCDFHNIETAYPETFNFPVDISVENVRQMNNLNINGVKFFKLGAIANKKIIPGTEKLFVGKNSWKVDTFVQQQEAGHLPVALDWVGKTYATTYNNVSGKAGSISTNTPFTQYSNIRYSCTVYSSEDQNVSTHRLTCNAPCSIYMNGSLIYSGTPDGTTTVDYYFKLGWNEIIIMVYTNGSNLILDTDIDILKRGQRMYAIRSPYTLCTLFDLQYNVRNNRRDVYAITYINDEAVLVLNNYIKGIDYEFFYDYTTEANTKTKILFKAELSRDPAVTLLSPKLKSYTLRFL